jgi:hypothetical protein
MVGKGRRTPHLREIEEERHPENTRRHLDSKGGAKLFQKYPIFNFSIPLPNRSPYIHASDI